MLLGILIVLIATAGVIALSILTIRSDPSSKGRALTSAMLDPFNQVADPSKREAAAYVQQMEVGHDQEDEGAGDQPPEEGTGDPFERDLARQMRSPEAYLKRRGARGVPPDNGARV